MHRLYILFVFLAAHIFSQTFDLEVFADAALLMNAKSGKVLYEKNGSKKMYPASVTKIATALYILEKKNELLSSNVVASKHALDTFFKNPSDNLSKSYPYQLESDGSHFLLIKGETMPLKDLLYGILVVSGNDASNVAAEYVSGSIEDFMKEVNLFLREIGCINTTFYNPHGLHFSEHKTTAYDLAIMTKKALSNPKFVEIFSTACFTRPKTNKHQQREMTTYNRLMLPGRFFYPYLLGSKTGYHSKAKHNLVAAAEKDGRKLIAVVLGCNKTEERYQDAVLMFEKAFQEKMEIRTIIPKDKYFSIEVEGGNDILTSKLKEDLVYRYYPSEEESIKAFVYWDDLQAPIIKGAKVGSIKLMANNEMLQTVELYAEKDVKQSWLFSIRQFFKKI